MSINPDTDPPQLTPWSEADLRRALAELRRSDAPNWPTCSRDHGPHAETLAHAIARRAIEVSGDAAINVLRRWNARCSPPWPDDSLDRLILDVRSYDDLKAALLALSATENKGAHIRDAAPGTNGHGEVATAFAQRLAREALEAEGQNRHRALLILEHWNVRCSPEWDLDTLLDHAEKRYQKSKPVWDQRRDRWDFEDTRSENTRKLAIRLKVTIQQARNIVREGTTVVAHAEAAAELFGGRARDFLRQSGRRGPRIDWPKRLIGAGLADFMRETPGATEQDYWCFINELSSRKIDFG